MPSKIINLITGNPRKASSLQDATRKYGYTVVVNSVDCPEIQANTTAEIAAFAARWAADKTGRACVKMDSSFTVKEFGAFPGPYVRWVYEGLGAERFFNLTKTIPNKDVYIECSVAYCEPGQDPITFTSATAGILPDRLIPDGSFIDRLFVPIENNPDHLTLGELRESKPELIAQIWGGAEKKFIDWLIKQSKSQD